MGAVAALLFLKRYPARRIRLAVVSPLLFGVPSTPRPRRSPRTRPRRIDRRGPRYASSMPNAFAADLDKTAKELLADPSFLEGRKAAFFVGRGRSAGAFRSAQGVGRALPLAAPASPAFPRERHDPIGGKRGDQVSQRSWPGWTRPGSSTARKQGGEYMDLDINIEQDRVRVTIMGPIDTAGGASSAPNSRSSPRTRLSGTPSSTSPRCRR